MRKLDKFSERLTELMFHADNLTTERLGDKIGVGAPTISMWKNGQRNIRLENAIKLADYFNCSLDFLFGLSETVLDFIIKTPEPFYGRLRQIMQQKDVSLYRLVRETRVSNGNLDSWKKGGDPFMQKVIDLANYLETTIDYLVGRDR